jgi:hypothetical protein
MFRRTKRAQTTYNQQGFEVTNLYKLVLYFSELPIISYEFLKIKTIYKTFLKFTPELEKDLFQKRG